MQIKKAGYQQWRAAKLENYPCSVDEIIVHIDTLKCPGEAAGTTIMRLLKNANMAIYKCRDSFVERSSVCAFAQQFGLRRLDHHLCAEQDGVARLTVAHQDKRAGYIPYSNRALSWHTDGYYNDKDRQINAVVLHCVNPAETGGENALTDPEMVYLRLRDTDPRFVRALEHPACMTLPENRDTGSEIRPAVSGPVFSFDHGGCLHMRYSARKKNIRWRDNGLTVAALECLTGILNDETTPVFHYRLRAGEGLISNNVLHMRTAFKDGFKRRLLYRARFFDRCNTL